MAFKRTTKQADLKLELTDVKGDEFILIPQKPATLENYFEYLDVVKDVMEQNKIDGSLAGLSEKERKIKLQEQFLQNGQDFSSVKKLAEGMLLAIDFWYEKGIDFWKKHFYDMYLLREIMDYINKEFNSLKK
jgi:hypothetical protein